VSATRQSTFLVGLLFLLPLAPSAGAGHADLDSNVLTASSVGAAEPFARFRATNQALADFRGDGHVAVVAQNDNGHVYVLDPVAGRVLADLKPGDSSCASSCYAFEGITGPINAPVVADVDHSGRLSIIVAHTSATVTRYTFDPARSTATSFAFSKAWERRFNDYQSFTTMDASPVLADLEGKGQLDVVVAVEETGVFAVRPDGTLLWKQALPSGHATPAVADLDGDGRTEVILAQDDGLVFALEGATGKTRWRADLTSLAWPGSIPAAPFVGDLTGDGHPDVVVGLRDAHDGADFSNDHATLAALGHNGRVLWTAQPKWAAPLTHTRPVLVDRDGHGHPALLWADWNTIGHKPGDFEQVGPGHVALFDAATGKERWHKRLNVPASDMDLAVADLDGKGQQEVLAECTHGKKPGLCAFDLKDGHLGSFLETGPWSVSRGALVGDLWHDGTFSALVPVEQDGQGALLVLHGAHPLASAFPGFGALPVPGPASPPRGHGDSEAAPARDEHDD
jgi:outer membrane protein assembly factor BamB